MPRQSESLEVVIDGLRDDILWMLITYYALCKRRTLPDLQRMSREDFVVELNLLECAQRDLVMRLTALDDTKGNRSFRLAKKLKLATSLSRERQREIAENTKAFTDAVNQLKTDHRNKYIAHVSTATSVSPRLVQEVPKLADVISVAVRTLDAFENKRG